MGVLMMTDRKDGRPRIEDGKQKVRTVTLPDRLFEMARDIGHGNASAGIRRALDAFSEAGTDPGNNHGKI